MTALRIRRDTILRGFHAGGAIHRSTINGQTFSRVGNDTPESRAELDTMLLTAYAAVVCKVDVVVAFTDDGRLDRQATLDALDTAGYDVAATDTGFEVTTR